MQIKGGSVENTLDLAVFGDILVWVMTLFGLIPPTWLAKVGEKLFGRKKDFHEQLKELSDEPGFRDRIVNNGPVPMDSLHFNTEADHYYRTGTVYTGPVRKRLR